MNGNIIQRIWKRVVGFLKSVPQSKANAIYVAVVFFVVLIAFMEYKVFEAMYSSTGDIVLSVSVLTVTAFGGVVAETILHRNPKATDDQRLAADVIFYISLIASAIAGFGVWAKASNMQAVDLYYIQFALPDFSRFVFGVITVVTVLDVLLLRWYIRSDVDFAHGRRMAEIANERRVAGLESEESLVAFEVEVERKAKKLLKIEHKRREVREELTRIYGGNVPASVMEDAMRKLDAISKLDDEADDDGDGIANKNDTSYNPKKHAVEGVRKPQNSMQMPSGTPARAFPETVEKQDLEEKPNPTRPA